MVATGESKSQTLLDMLLDGEMLTREQCEHIVMLEEQDGRSALQIIDDERMVDPEQFIVAAGLFLGIPFVNLKRQEIEEEVIGIVPEWICRKYGIVPIRLSDGVVEVAMADPGDLQRVDEISATLRKPVEAYLAMQRDVDEAIDRHYRIGGDIASELRRVQAVAADPRAKAGDESTAEAIAEAPVVRAVDLLIRQAARDRASDIHIEPQETEVRVRFRIDGILHDVMPLPISVHSALISRIKIIAGMNIAETRRPQDGQISVRDGNRELDVRVATAPTVNGEMAVLRLLDKTFAFRTLPELGFRPEALETYQQLMKLPFGMVLVSGPTGSGKTTSLYASLNQLDTTGRNILTIEDPVEYRFAKINQMQVNVQAGLTFASGLRAAMRLDPDVILVGEIRDAETAGTAVQAALTGHLVLSTVHANDAAGVIFRLIDLGVEPFLIASAVGGVIAQRMVRQICPNCATMAPVLSEERLAYEKEMNEERTEFVYGTGCSYCARTGYLGRTGIFEVMTITEAIRRLILTGASADEIRTQAVEDGTISLWRDGMMKVNDGITTPYEVIRNVFTIT
ncbi:MAG: type II/IV secretion system protein [Chloroflexi bacterium]|nr:type II/IV secretion system protein [Chloroflexota bacterium]MCH7655112.1 type II/IV secretion system protein [Chloroflexota bacterium]